MNFSSYIGLLGALSGNASKLFFWLASKADGCLTVDVKSADCCADLGWKGDAGRKRLSRAMIELVESGLITKKGRKVCFVEPDSKKKEEVKQPDQVKQKAKPEVKPKAKPEVKPEKQHDEPMYSEDFETKYTKIVAAANELLPAKTVTVGKVGRTIKHKVYTYISNNGYELLKKAMIKASRCQVIQKKFANMDLGRLVDLADNILAGLYDKDFSTNKKGDQVEMITTRELDQFERRANGIN